MAKTIYQDPSWFLGTSRILKLAELETDVAATEMQICPLTKFMLSGGLVVRSINIVIGHICQKPRTRVQEVPWVG